VTAARRLAATLLALGRRPSRCGWRPRLVWLRAAIRARWRGPCRSRSPALCCALSCRDRVLAWRRRAVVATRVAAPAGRGAGRGGRQWAVRLSWCWGGAGPGCRRSPCCEGEPVDGRCDGAGRRGRRRRAGDDAAAALGLAPGAAVWPASGWCLGGSMPRLGARYARRGTVRRVPDRDSQWWDALDRARTHPEGPRAPGASR